MKVFEEKGVRQYLGKRNILTQYQQAKENFEAGRFQQIQLKKRQPKNFKDYSFALPKNTELSAILKHPNNL
ncbi:hypothetical protein [Mariniflexile sp.]|uniref:hypothetical protein n=1 Tax=Mariniflexile sp. TaxID=1979402 RepID=UPI0040478A67